MVWLRLDGLLLWVDGLFYGFFVPKGRRKERKKGERSFWMFESVDLSVRVTTGHLPMIRAV